MRDVYSVFRIAYWVTPAHLVPFQPGETHARGWLRRAGADRRLYVLRIEEASGVLPEAGSCTTEVVGRIAVHAKIGAFRQEESLHRMRGGDVIDERPKRIGVAPLFEEAVHGCEGVGGEEVPRGAHASRGRIDRLFFESVHCGAVKVEHTPVPEDRRVRLVDCKELRGGSVEPVEDGGQREAIQAVPTTHEGPIGREAGLIEEKRKIAERAELLVRGRHAVVMHVQLHSDGIDIRTPLRRPRLKGFSVLMIYGDVDGIQCGPLS